MTLRQRARSAHLNGQFKMAIELYKKLIEEDCIPEDVGNLGSLLTNNNQLNEAIGLYEKHLRIWPSNFQLLFNGSNSYFKAGKLNESITLLQKAIEIQPRNFNAVRRLTNILIETNNNRVGINILESFCNSNPKEGLAWLELGIIYFKLKQLVKALEAFNNGSKALPDHTSLIANRLTVLKDLKRFKQAQEIYKNLQSTQKENINIRGAWSGILLKTNKTEEAIDLLEKLVNEQPEMATHWINLAAGKKELKHNLDCQKYIKKGLVFHPENNDLKQFLAQTFAESGNALKAIKLLDIEKTNWSEAPDEHIFNTQFIGSASQLINAEKLAEIARVWERKKINNGINPLWKDTIREKLTQRKLKIAYLSADFCNHPVSRFLLPVIETHNRELVEILGLNCGSNKDKVTDLIRSHCDKWVELAGVEDLAFARLISDLKIDVIIELGGFTGNSRLGVLIHKPAPIQLSYLGYFAPTYLKCMDGWIGDNVLFGSLNSNERKEKLIYMDEGYMAYKPVQMPTIKRNKSKYIRFGSFNNSRKLTSESLELFSQIVQKHPNSQLVIKSITFVEDEEKSRINELLIQSGLNNSQIILLDWVEGTKAHMELYKWIDIALDPFPYGGATTTAEALWMGVPVISLAGKGMVGRLSSSILKSANCGEWIAKDLNHYKQIAKELAKEGPREENIRQELREKVKQSPFANGRRISSQLENYLIKQINKSKLI